MTKPVMTLAFNLFGLRVRIEAERKTQAVQNETAPRKNAEDLSLSQQIPKPPVEGRYGPGLFG